MKKEHHELLRKKLSHIKFPPPKTYERIGNVLIVPLHDKWSPFEEEIGKAYMEVFGVQSVMKKGPVGGEFRLPSCRKIAGDSTVTTHKENGIFYRLDVARLMFSSGNIKERMRMARLPAGEMIIDMFSGIGYFSLPLAKFCGSEVVALEKNPESYSYLCENVRLNHLEKLVEPKNMDCREYEGKADRVIMGYFGAHKFLKKAFFFLEEGHLLYHDAVPENVIQRPIWQLQKEAERTGRRMEIVGFRKVKRFSPGVWHVCVEARVYP